MRLQKARVMAFSLARRQFLNDVRPVAHSCSVLRGKQQSGLATAVPPVTQNATSSKGPTAMVFLNMGGPSTTDEVQDFLSRLFVSYNVSSSLH